MNIYIGNLSLETTENELLEVFSQFGEVASVTIMNDKHIGSGQPRGYGYIEMDSKQEAENAINRLEGKTLKNRVINVVAALPLTKDRPRNTDYAHKTRPYQRGRRIPAHSI